MLPLNNETVEKIVKELRDEKSKSKRKMLNDAADIIEWMWLIIQCREDDTCDEFE